ncbi:hypothetical protein [Deinococcus roseus]|uniref:Uncharacterized protein n=1 Tax=Deinococcus roseus TaxID=392414 RepID=A0ABQ2DEM6_9DEIO|nr:hypothetical protein [Deinococcus roseus]GGJ54186.1 hypothetical protein GCM10008938_45320 [Deinococcus roseus]
MPRKKTTQTPDVDGTLIEAPPSADDSALHLPLPSNVLLSAEVSRSAKPTRATRKSTSKKTIEQPLLETPVAPRLETSLAVGAAAELTVVEIAAVEVAVLDATDLADESALDIDAPPDAPLPAELNSYVTSIKSSKTSGSLDPLKLPLLDYRPAYLAPDEKVHVLLTGLHMFSEQNPLLDNIGCRIIRTVQYHLSSPLSDYVFTEGMRPQASGELLITSKRLVFNSVSSFLTVKWEELESVDSFSNALRLNIRHLRHGLIFSMQDRIQIDQASRTLSHYLNQ